MKYLVQHFLDDTFREHATRTAIKQGNRLFSYAEIDKLSKICQKYLLDEPPPRRIIGILSRVRAEAIAAMIGALRSGVVYVPLNTLAPVSWLASVIADAQIEVLLVDPAFSSAAESLRSLGIKKIIYLDDPSEQMPAGTCLTFREIGEKQAVSSVKLSSNDLEIHPSSGRSGTLADDLAWVLYTSGSTGTPKGIMITHRNAFTFIDWMKNEFKLSLKDRIFNRAPLQFDLSVFDIFSTFASGAQLIIAEMGFSNRPDDVLELMRREEVTIVYTVPSTFINWMGKGDLSGGIPSLRLVLYAGEPFPLPYLKKFMQFLPSTAFSNIYGPTETNIVTYYHISEIKDEWESVPIGKPVHDTEIFIVDDELNRVPDGEIGEILVRGGTVFAGYFNDPERTAQKLIQSPFHSYPTLCCRTGDLGRFLPDGNIVYHGRADNCVKTRGYRVELGEVETALSSISGLDEVAVIARPHEKYGNSLHAFVSCKNSGLSERRIIEELSGKIPSYMLPYEVIVLEILPKTSTGKIDRVGLRESLEQQRSTR